MRRFLGAALLLLPLSAFAADGSTGAEFLKIGAGARPTAMGDAQVALAEGALAALWNPAGLGGLKANEVLFSHNKWLDDITDQRFVAAFALKNVGAVALAYERLALGDMPGFDAQSNLTGSLKSGDDVISLSWGRNLVSGAGGGSGLFVGAGAKSITEKIAGRIGLGLRGGFRRHRPALGGGLPTSALVAPVVVGVGHPPLGPRPEI
jgi:hypothetical protein